MKIKAIEKEEMYKLVKAYAGSVNSMHRDDYFAMAKSADDCSFEICKDKAVLKFKGVEIYPGFTEDENSWETSATLYFNGHYDDYYKAHYFDLEVREEVSEPIHFESSEALIKECGIKLTA